MIFGISGRMGSGKDTIGAWLVEMGLSSATLAFADGVYLVVEEVFGCPRTDRSNRARLFRQCVGSHMREISFEVDGHRDVWINMVARRVHREPVKGFAITDVRHVNEAEWILKKENGMLIFLHAPSDLRRRRIERRDGIQIDDKMWEKWSSHETEQNLDAIHELFADLPSFVYFEMTHDRFEENKSTFRALLAEHGMHTNPFLSVQV